MHWGRVGLKQSRFGASVQPNGFTDTASCSYIAVTNAFPIFVQETEQAMLEQLQRGTIRRNFPEGTAPPGAVPPLHVSRWGPYMGIFTKSCPKPDFRSIRTENLTFRHIF